MHGATNTASTSSEDESCLDIREFRRLKYFFGQMLGAQDFQSEQDYFREKHKLHNRCLHGYGVVCGLLVRPVPMARECNSEEDEERRKLWEELETLFAQKASLQPPTAAPAASTPPGTLGSPASGDPTAAGNPAAAEGPAAAGSPAAAGGRAAAGKPTAAGSPAVGSPTSNSGPPADAIKTLDAQVEKLRRRLGEFYKKHCREEPRTCVEIDCGIALDCEGNELVVRKPLRVDLAQSLSPSDYQRVKQGADTLYVSLCFCERPVDPVRPVISDSCGATPDCVYGKLQDCVHVQVTLDPPAAAKCGGTCCEPCTEKCVLLARISGFCPGHPLHEHRIHNHVRRPVSVYSPVTIVGTSWRHGHHYTQEEAKDLMGTEDGDGHRSRGLEVRFSRPVLASTIRRGVMDTWIIEGGRGRRGGIYDKGGRFVDKPLDGTVDRLFYRDATDETLEPGDRVLVILRTDFILDDCCHPVDGENVGGRVPVLEDYARRFEPYDPGQHDPEHDEHRRPSGDCQVPPIGCLPWTSGNGTPGGTFVSWFYIRERDNEFGPKGHRTPGQTTGHGKDRQR